MTEAQSSMAFALKMYGEATLAHAKESTCTTFSNMTFWQNQLWMCANDLAAEE